MLSLVRMVQTLNGSRLIDEDYNPRTSWRAKVEVQLFFSEGVQEGSGEDDM